MDKLKRGLAPFWFWNGDVTKEELRRQLRLFKEQGLSGVLLHPRQGMAVPYLSHEFFSDAAFAAEEAGKLGLDLWLYDEFPYPSAACAGEVVLEHPEYAVKELVRSEAVCEGRADLSSVWGHVLLARAYRMQGEKTDWDDSIDLSGYAGTSYCEEVFQFSGMTRYNKKRYFQGSPVKRLTADLPEGRWRVMMFTERVMKDFKYFGTFPDPLKKDAVKCFLDLTHERYASVPALSSRFGGTVKGFFSDEVTAFPPEFPWSDEIVRYVEEHDGFDLVSFLPALYEDMGEKTSRVRYCYWKAASELFFESYDKQLEAWCSAHGLRYACEKPLMRSRQAKHIDVPGIDTAHWKAGTREDIIEARYRGNGKIVSSAAHFYGKELCLCEPFHSIGWGMTLQDMKAALDWLTITGITLFNPHAAYYTTDGLRKHDAPPSSFYQMPWWKDYHELTGYLEKIQDFVSSGERVVKILVADPVTSTWTSLGEEKLRLSRAFAELQNAMLRNGLDYYIADSDLFAGAEIGLDDDGVYIKVNDDRFHDLVLPFMKNMEKLMADKVREYLKEGGRAYFIGLIPYEDIEGRPGEVIEGDGERIREGFFSQRPAASSRSFYGTAEEALNALKEAVRMPFSVLSSLPFAYMTVRTGNGCRLFGVNLSERSGTVEVAWEGKRTERTLKAFQSLMLASDSIQAEPGQNTFILPLDKTVPMELEDRNSLWLGKWDLVINGQEYRAVDTLCIYETMEKLGLSVPCRGSSAFGCPKVFHMDRLDLSYSTSFDVKGSLEGPLYLVVEKGAIEGEDIALCVNGSRIDEGVMMRGVRPEGFYHDITAMARTGQNRITLSLSTDSTTGGLSNPLYLTGCFSVSGRSLCPFRAEGSVLDRTASGIPHYSGTIRYTFRMDGRYSRIELPSPAFEDAATLYVNGMKAGTRCWSPYTFQVPDGLMKEKDNVLTLFVDTTLLPLFEGARYDRKEDRYVEA